MDDILVRWIEDNNLEYELRAIANGEVIAKAVSSDIDTIVAQAINIESDALNYANEDIMYQEADSKADYL
jgi:hypothetical protein